MDEAEEQCRRLYCGAHPWSPTYKRSELLLEYWLNRKDYALGLNNNVQQLIYLQRKLQISYDPTLTLPAIIDEVQNSTKKIHPIISSLLLLFYKLYFPIASSNPYDDDCNMYTYHNW